MKATTYKIIIRTVIIVISYWGDFGPTIYHPRNLGVTWVKLVPNCHVGPAPRKIVLIYAVE